MNARQLGAPAAVAVLVGVQVLFAPTAPKAPEPAKGTLTVDLEGAEGAAEPATLKVRANGAAPTAAATLKDTTGQHTATIITGSAADCAGAGGERVAIPQGDSVWCLIAKDVTMGQELGGEVTGADGDNVTLTVRRRDAFFPGPAAWMVLGLLAGLAVLVVPGALRRVVRWIVLNRLLNKASKPDPGIVGLKQWTKDRLGDGASHEDVIAATSAMVTDGRRKAAEARTALHEALKKSPLKDKHPYREAASDIAETTTDNVADFYGKDGEALKQHPAATWLAGLQRLAAYKNEFDRRQEEINKTLDEPDRVEPQKELDQALVTFEEIPDPEAVPRLDDRLEELIVAIEDARAKVTADQRRRRAVEAVAAQRAARGPRGALETVIPLGLSKGTLAGWTVLAVLATLLFFIPVLFYAVATVKSTTYDPKATFDSLGDYLALFSAALGSAAAATAVAWFGYWSTQPQEEA